MSWYLPIWVGGVSGTPEFRSRGAGWQPAFAQVRVRRHFSCMADARWTDLARDFRDLDAAMGEARLERQWDDVNEEWRVAGRHDLESARRFRAVASRAGELLGGEGTAEGRWFRHLWEQGGPHAPPLVGMVSMHGRASSGMVSVGRIEHPARLSASLAERLAAGS